MEENRDVVVFTDEEGNDFELCIIDSFEYLEQEYAVLMDASEDECDDPECECQQEVYIMKVVVNGDMEEFLPADEDKMDILAAIVEQRLSEDCGCDCEGCNGADDHSHEECDCGCKHD